MVPGIAVLRGYRRRWLAKDLVAGLVLTALLVPQGMAYAELAGLPAVTGLYTSILCLIGYAVFGPSRILVLGPDSALGPMIAATIIPLAGANGDPARAIALASILAMMVGAIMILAAVAKLGLIADLLSTPTRIGYMNGLALTIVIGSCRCCSGSPWSARPDRRINEVRAGRRERGNYSSRTRDRCRGPARHPGAATVAAGSRPFWSPSCSRSPPRRCSTWPPAE